MRRIKHFRTTVRNTSEQIRGVFTSNKRGFGFVTVEGIKEDFFIPLKYTQNAFHGDIVGIVPLPKKRGKRNEAKIVSIISHSILKVVGTYDASGTFGFVRPDNQKISNDIYIPQSKELNAKNGDKVICIITDYGSEKRKPTGYISEIIGNSNDPSTDIASIIRAFEIKDTFDDDVLAEVLSIPEKVEKKDKKGRLDLTNELIISIDGDDSKDLDDAISLKKEGEYYLLGVHIADVSHYVNEKTAIDREAYKRGTSVYLIDVVIPMLHESLSNGICSLLQDVERLTLSCIMKIDKNGVVKEYSINNGFITNKRQMTYNIVNEILANPDCEHAKENTDVIPMLFLMKELSDILHKKRDKRGAIDFEVPEAKIVLDKKGMPIHVGVRERGESERIIEEFMLIANETVAKSAYDEDLPLLYRSHPAPETEKVRELVELCNQFGIRFNGNRGEVQPKDIRDIIEAVRGTEKESLLSTVTLRSMQQAKYSSFDTEHFGLAATHYCHFTSPIRRYPDLLVHRIIKENMRKPLGSRRFKHFLAITTQAAEHTSRMERRAIDCEREVDKLKKCEYMIPHIGEEFCGIISGVTSWGFYVSLPNTVEGMVPINKIEGDYYIYKEKAYGLFGERTGRSFCLGDTVSVIVDSIDLDSRTIDFRIKKDGKDRKKTNSFK